MQFQIPRLRLILALGGRESGSGVDQLRAGSLMDFPVKEGSAQLHESHSGQLVPSVISELIQHDFARLYP